MLASRRIWVTIYLHLSLLACAITVAWLQGPNHFRMRQHRPQRKGRSHSHNVRRLPWCPCRWSLPSSHSLQSVHGTVRCGGVAFTRTPALLLSTATGSHCTRRLARHIRIKKVPKRAYVLGWFSSIRVTPQVLIVCN